MRGGGIGCGVEGRVEGEGEVRGHWVWGGGEDWEGGQGEGYWVWGGGEGWEGGRGEGVLGVGRRVGWKVGWKEWRVCM